MRCLHARWAPARQLFQRVGMISCPNDDPFDDVRRPGFRHVQLGDAVSLGYGEIEAEFYRWLTTVVGVDDALLGNHELPAVWWHRASSAAVSGSSNTPAASDDRGRVHGGVAALVTHDDGATFRLEVVDDQAGAAQNP